MRLLAAHQERQQRSQRQSQASFREPSQDSDADEQLATTAAAAGGEVDLFSDHEEALNAPADLLGENDQAGGSTSGLQDPC